MLLLLVLLLQLLLLFAARGARAPSTARALFFCKRLCCVQLGEGEHVFLLIPPYLLIPTPNPYPSFLLPLHTGVPRWGC